MKKLICCIFVLLSFNALGESYLLQIDSNNRTLSRSFVVATNAVGEPVSVGYTLNCVEGVLDVEAESCIVTDTVSKAENCPNGYTNNGDGTCSIQESISANAYCASGTDTGSGCSDIEYRSRYYGCPLNHRQIGQDCYDFEGSYYDAVSCPSEYIRDLSRCYLRSTLTNQYWQCHTGYTMSGNTCYRENVIGYSYSCTGDYTLNGSNCEKEVFTAVTYASCPNGYTEINTTTCELVTINPAVKVCPEGRVYNEANNSCL